MENKCPNCKEILQKTINGSTLTFKCENCGYEFATTIAEGIKWDFNDYTIIICKNNDVAIDKIKAIASISLLNFIDSKKILIEGGIIAKDRATIIKNKIDKLKEAGVEFIVEPKFPY